MVKELITMDMPIESVYHDYKLVADSIIDDESFQKADTGILLSNLYDVVKALEKQIPKKVVFVHPLQEDDGGDYMCPSCKSGTVYDAYGNRPPYCHYCGQALEWE